MSGMDDVHGAVIEQLLETALQPEDVLAGIDRA